MSGLVKNIAKTFQITTRCASMSRPLASLTAFKNKQVCLLTELISVRHKSDNGQKDLSEYIEPLSIKPHDDPDGINLGAEITGEALKKDDLIKVLNEFFRRPEVKRLAAESGLDRKLFHQAYVSFRRFCIESTVLPVDLHVVLSDILQDAGHADDILPFFLQHAITIFPHLDCMDDLRKISDLRQPANWYPEARSIQRKIVYHAGPTNSGKTHHALERFMTAKSGVYCGPLRLLANEVFSKTNALGTTCDLVTGEERRYMGGEDEPSNHVACTVEMTSVTTPYEVAIIDEIQMMRDGQRGWAWTRALLGVCAHEVHVCGEVAGINLVQEFADIMGDELEVRKYKRLTPLTVLKKTVELETTKLISGGDSSVRGDGGGRGCEVRADATYTIPEHKACKNCWHSKDHFTRIHPGDCIVCFSKNDIYHCSRQLEKLGVEVAVIYGTLPSGTKIAQAQKFNDPNNSCKVMVSTDAIGMGLNLNIKRIIFYSLVKPTVNEKGEKEIDVIPPTTALQIAGRAGRYGTTWEEGEVTTYRSIDLPRLKKLLNTKVASIEQAGLHPTAEQIELFAYHLPKATLANLIDIFVTLSQLDSDKYFMCSVDEFKFLANMIEHVPLQLRTRYVFCCAPIPKKQPFVCTMFLKFCKQYSKGSPLSWDWLCRQIGWPFSQPTVISDLVHLECVFDVLDLYLWLSYRFPDMFPDPEHVRDMQKDLDEIIQVGIIKITQLLRNSETGVTSGLHVDEDDFEMKKRAQQKRRDEQELSVMYTEEAEDLLTSEEEAEALPISEENPKSLSGRFQKAEKSQQGLSSVLVRPVKRLTEQLIEKGLITEEMLRKLQKEMLDDVEEDGGYIGPRNGGRGKKR